MKAIALISKIEKAGFELSKVGSNEVMELFKFNAHGKLYSFCVGNGEAYGCRREFENGECPSYFESAAEMLKSANRI